MKRKTLENSKTVDEETKSFIEEVFLKFKALSPHSQQKAIKAMNNLINEEPNKKMKSLLTKLNTIFVRAAKTEAKSDEK